MVLRGNRINKLQSEQILTILRCIECKKLSRKKHLSQTIELMSTRKLSCEYISNKRQKPTILLVDSKAIVLNVTERLK